MLIHEFPPSQTERTVYCLLHFKIHFKCKFGFFSAENDQPENLEIKWNKLDKYEMNIRNILYFL